MVLKDLKKVKGAGVLTWVTKTAADTQKFTHKAIEKSADLIIICGGDGTANKVVNAVMEYEPSKRPVLAIFPCGSANDFSKSLGTNNVSETLKKFASGQFEHVDLCQVSSLRARAFALNMATCGIGANVVQTVNLGRRWIPPSARFFMSTVTWLVRYKPPRLKVRIGDMAMENQLFLAAFGNGKYVGSGLGLCPQAELNNGKFAVTLISKINLFDFFRHIRQIRLAKLIKNDPRILYHSSGFAELKVLKGNLNVEMDGEHFQSLKKGDSVRFSCSPKAIRFITGN